MTVTRLTGGLTPADGGDPRTFPAIWNGTADDIEAGDYSKVPSGGSVGQVLVKDSGTDYDASWEELGVGLIPPVSTNNTAPGWVTGRTGGLQPGSTRNLTNTTSFGHILRVPTKTIFKGIGVYFSATTANAGSVCRLGIAKKKVNDQWSNYELVLDAGTVTADTAGIKEIAITPITLDPGIYVLVSAVQGITSGTVTAISTSGGDPHVGVAWLTSGPTWVSPGNSINFGAQSGAFPSTLTATPGTNPPLVWLEMETI